MRHNCNTLLFSPSQPHPRLPRPLLNRRARGRPLPRLAVPPLHHESQIHRLVSELVTQDIDIAAGVAGQVARLLYLWQRDDFHAFFQFGWKGAEGSVEGTADGRGNEEVDIGVVGEKSGEVAALAFAKRGQGWVGHVVVCSTEVVVALGVADEVDRWGHLEAASGDGLRMRVENGGTVCFKYWAARFLLRGSKYRISLEASRFKLIENDTRFYSTTKSAT